MGVRVLKRRLISSSSEYEDPDTGACSIEYFMAMKDHFRVAPANRIPIPWPFDLHIASAEAEKLISELENPIEEILREQQIDFLQVRVFSLTRRGFPSDQCKDTVVIASRDENTQNWLLAATEIHDLIQKSAKPAGLKIAVEIRNNARMYRDTSSIIQPNTDIHRALLQIESVVTAQVKEDFGDDWKTISYMMRGPSYQDSDRKPTVVIGVKPGTRSLWAFLEEKLRKVIESVQAPNIEICTEIVPSLLMPAAIRDYKPSSPQILRKLTHIPPNGSSIGPRLSSTEAGSVGVWIYVQPPGSNTKKKAFLTCYHVIASGDPENRHTNDINGIGLEGKKPQKLIEVDYPARFDARHTKQAFADEVSQGTGLSEGSKQSLEIIDHYMSKNGIGLVEYASGFRVNHENSRMDWAIVVPTSAETFMQNMPPPAANFNSPRLLWNGRIDYDPAPNEVITRIADPVKGGWVSKVGRTTGTTVGEVSAMQTQVHWERGKPSTEIQIVVTIGGNQFASAGDSGSMVINQHREWIGIVVGSDIQLEAGYMMSAKRLMEDIKLKTGCTISLA